MDNVELMQEIADIISRENTEWIILESERIQELNPGLDHGLILMRCTLEKMLLVMEANNIKVLDFTK